MVPVLRALPLIACVPFAPPKAHREQPAVARIFQGGEDPGGLSALTERRVLPPKIREETAARFSAPGDVCRHRGQ